MGYRVYPQQDLSDPSHMFSFQLNALKSTTMWKPDNQKYYIPFMILFAVNVFVLAICTVGLLLKGCSTKDLVDRSEAMDIFTLTGSALYKMVFFLYHYEQLVDMVTCGLALVRNLPEGWTKNCGLLSRIHYTAGFLVLLIWGLAPILKVMYGETTWAEMKLPINTYDPFDSTGFLFFLFYITGQYVLVLSAVIYMAADCYLFTSIYVAVGALQYIVDQFENMRDLNNNNKHTVADTMHDCLQECIEIHVHVLDYLRKTDKLFKSMILADVVHAVISLSFAMLQTSESKGIFEGVKMVLFVQVCFVHQFLNSHFGQELIDKQDNLAKQIITDIPWTDASRKFKKSYYIMLTCVREPFKLSAWNVYFLQYATFLEFSKTMIQYYMVLQEVQDEAEVS
uniref:Odorant receptor n=1 Tax=Apolygus lucorum TaxID=248454 RepID=A0A1Q1NIJ3_APOLU|nr:olfactory receptor 46 [Apolygus lucorum]AQM56045.1 olfactory receptor [Apolygus lucorum]